MDYKKMSLIELRDYAKSKGLKGLSKLNKPDLIALLEEKEPAQKEAQPSVKPASRETSYTTEKQIVRNTPVTAERKPSMERPVDTERKPSIERPIDTQRVPRTAPPVSRQQTSPYRDSSAFRKTSVNGHEQPMPAKTIQKPASAYQAQAQREKQAAAQARPATAAPSTGNESLASFIQQNYQLEGSSADSGVVKSGILEVCPEGFAFIRCDNFLPGTDDVYVSPTQVRRFGLRTGDYIVGNMKVKTATEKFSALLYIKTVNKLRLEEICKRKRFDELTPVFPNSRFHLETQGGSIAMRMVDLLSPIGKGQRGMIVSPPKAGKTTLLKQVAKALTTNHPGVHLIILLIDERPEEVTDMKESISGDNVEVIYSTFDELPENHKRVSEMVIERAKRLVEQKQDVVILLDSITRLARAYNLTVPTSGRTLSGGLDPAALHMPKKFFGAARCMREGGSLTILATALVDTGSRMDDVVFEEFKGTGNMELVLDRNLSERRVFPAIDLPKSGTRREDLLLSPLEMEANAIIRRAFNSARTDDVVENIIRLFTTTRNNMEFAEMVKKTKIVP